MPKSGVYYRVYLHQKVRQKIPFFDGQVYPVYILVILGRKTLNFKSQLFSQLIKEKYQASFRINNCSPDIQTVISHERALVAFIIQKLGSHFSLQLFKEEYSFYSTDIAHVIDQFCKQFLIQFFNQHSLHALELFIIKTADILSSDIILKDLQASLASSIQENLFCSLLPYIRLFEFYRQQKPPNLPILTYYKFREKAFHSELSIFLNSEKEAFECLQLVKNLMESQLKVPKKYK